MVDNNEELLEYLKNDVAHLKIQNELSKRQSHRWFIALITSLFILLIAILSFSSVVFVITSTYRSDCIPFGDWEVVTGYEKEKIVQNATVDGQNHSSINTIETKK